MTRQQTTINKEFSITGLELHTGNEVTLRVKPAPPNSGIKFVARTENGPVEIPADITSVPSDKVTPRNTTLTRNGVSIHTVEHLLAACYGLQIDNLEIEITGNEPPVPTTGSYEAYVRAFQEIGIVNQGVPTRTLDIDRPITYTEGDVELIAVPSDRFRISFTIQYPNRHIGTQYATFDITPEIFEKEISPARTFVMSEDVEELRGMGLIQGGSLENAIVFNDSGIVNDEPLRFPDECVRHKVLDLIGDLSLLGRPIKGHIHAVRSGHTSNLQFVRKLWKLREERERRDGLQRDGIWDQHDSGNHAAPLSVSIGGQNLGTSRQEKSCRYQECDDQRTIFCRAFSRTSHHARGVDYRGDGSGGRHLVSKYC